MQLREGFDTHVITDASPRSTPTAALRRPKPPGDLPASTCALPRTCSSPSTDANTTHQSLKAAPVSRLGRPFSCWRRAVSGFAPRVRIHLGERRAEKGGVRGGQLNEIPCFRKASLAHEAPARSLSTGSKDISHASAVGKLLRPFEAGTYRGLRSAFVAALCIAHFCYPILNPILIILITRVDTRATDIMVMTGKRSGGLRRSCGLSERRHLGQGPFACPLSGWQWRRHNAQHGCLKLRP